LTLGSGPARFQTEPPACYRASWQLPGPDLHRQATTSLQTIRLSATSRTYLQFCWAHEKGLLFTAKIESSNTTALALLIKDL